MSNTPAYLPTVLVLFSGPTVVGATSRTSYYNDRRADDCYESLAHLHTAESKVWYSHDSNIVYVQANGDRVAYWQDVLSKAGFTPITPTS